VSEVRVLVADDHPVFRDGLAMLLGSVDGIARRIAAFFAAGPPAPTDAFPQLTGREREILDLVAAGRSNAQIAATLYLSPKTVRNNVSNVFTKLQVADRAEAIVRAREAGLG